MKPEIFRSVSSAEQPPLPELEAVANKLQLLLMPLAYQEEHPEIHAVDPTDPETKKNMVTEWLTHYAKEFRDYLEDKKHAHETIDLNDPSALHDFLSKLKRESETLQ